MPALRSSYEAEFQKYDQYEPDWMGPRGAVNEKTRHLAVAGARGLFPEKDAVYINYTGPGQVDGFMESENNIINDRNVTLNADGTFTAHFGSKRDCGEQTNRVGISDSWNFLLRIYRPGEAVLKREYTLQEVTRIGT